MRLVWVFMRNGRQRAWSGERRSARSCAIEISPSPETIDGVKMEADQERANDFAPGPGGGADKLARSLKDAYNEVLQATRTVVEAGTGPAPPEMSHPLPDSDMQRWLSFELDRGVDTQKTYVYVDWENVLSTINSVSREKMPRVSCEQAVRVTQTIFGDWLGLGGAGGAADTQYVWCVYSKRSLQGARQCAFDAGQGYGEGDEIDDVLCVSAACARVRLGSRKVFLVSGDEMRWTSLCPRLLEHWKSVDRGPRESFQGGNRLAASIVRAINGCEERGEDLLVCEANAPQEPTPVFDGSVDFVDATDQPLAASYDDDIRNQSVFGEIAGVAIILGASLLALTLVQRA